jgi:hypothetical protein
MTLHEQFEIEKLQLPKGWHWLMDSLMGMVQGRQQQYVKLLNSDDNRSFAATEKPLFKFVFDQTKEKLGYLRLYIHIERVDHDWNVYDESDYERKFLATSNQIAGYAAALESISGNICQVSGNRGSIRNVNGWLTCLSDEEFSKL